MMYYGCSLSLPLWICDEISVGVCAPVCVLISLSHSQFSANCFCFLRLLPPSEKANNPLASAALEKTRTSLSFWLSPSCLWPGSDRWCEKMNLRTDGKVRWASRYEISQVMWKEKNRAEWNIKRNQWVSVLSSSSPHVRDRFQINGCTARTHTVTLMQCSDWRMATLTVFILTLCWFGCEHKAGLKPSELPQLTPFFVRFISS